MVVQHNIPAINSHRNLLVNNTATAKNLEKLSSGYRINRAGDDAAGLAISEKMRGQIRGLAKAEENAQNAISLVQTAEGGLQEIHSILQRMRELAVQSANGTYKDEVDRENLNLEFQSLKSEIDRISDYTNYNGIKLLNGELGSDVRVFSSSFTAANFSSFTGISSFTYATASGTGHFDATDIRMSYDSNSGVLTATITDGTDTYTASGTVDSTGKIEFAFDGTRGTSTDNDAKLTIQFAAGWEKSVNDFVLQSKTDGGTFGIASIAALVGYTGQVMVSENPLIFQIGANGTTDQQVKLYIQSMRSDRLGEYTLVNELQNPYILDSAVQGGETVADQNIATRDDANAAIDVLDNAINMVSTQRAGIGALQNRLEYTLNNLGVTKENLTSAESVIRDVDMAKEMMEFTKNQILVQASQAMLATANQLPQGILNLLR